MRLSRKGPSGVYRIMNTVNGKCYVGSAVNTHARWRVHLHSLRQGRHHSIHIQRAWDKYGEGAFVFELVEAVADKARLLEREQAWIDNLKCCNRACGYNISKFAGSKLGLKHSPEALVKMSAAAHRSKYRRDDLLTVTYRGETKPLFDFARENGLDPNIVRNRVRTYGWTIEAALETPIDAHQTWITYNGKTQTRAEWAKEHGLGENTLKQRLERGMQLEEALLMPTDPEKWTHGGRTQTLLAWSEELGMTVYTLRTRKRLGWSVTKCLTTPVGAIKGGRVPAKSFTHAGKTQGLLEWSQEYGINKQTLWQRLKWGWTMEKALNTPATTGRKQVMLTHDGQTKTVGQWAKEHGLSKSLLYSRVVTQGWPMERALSTPGGNKKARE